MEVEEEPSVESKVWYYSPVANESSGGKIIYCYHFPGKTGGFKEDTTTPQRGCLEGCCLEARLRRLGSKPKYFV